MSGLISEGGLKFQVVLIARVVLICECGLNRECGLKLNFEWS